ncbi:MAG TPA: MotA/TolQ/ExbB proton channel family protein [Planctomycetota bacterium]|nr:MotA/TolQ/ExbB proton channel family protein [Planctomycetota bacterium]
MIDRAAAAIAGAGVFAAPLLATAALTFGVAARCAMALRRPVAPAEIRGAARALRLVAAGCSSAPLLGLLGTVHGLSRTFRSIDPGRPWLGAELAGGVQQALITSEIGLCVAIPGLLLHAALRRAIRRRLVELGGAP